MNDLKFAFRQLLKNPGFTAVAVLTLALGIGANTAIFNILSATLFPELPFPDSDRLVRIHRTTAFSGSWENSQGDFVDYRDQAHSFDGMAAITWRGFNFAGPRQSTERITAVAGTADLFRVLGIHPALGRGYTPDEDQPGNNVAVLSHRFWVRQFECDTNVIGATIRLDGDDTIIIGVMPKSADCLPLIGWVDLWQPLAMTPLDRTDRGNHFLHVVGRLKSGVSVMQAQGELSAIAGRLEREFPTYNSGAGVRVLSLGDSLQPEFGTRGTWFALGITTFVLFIACANLTNLQLARVTARAREFAVRGALGASRSRLIRQLLAESLVISLLGGALALVLATWCTDIVIRWFAPDLLTPPNIRMVCFALVCCFVSVLAFGTAPAWLASNVDPIRQLKENTRGAIGNRSQHWLQRALIIGEVALALMLLTAAGASIHLLYRFANVDPGWSTKDLFTARVAIAKSKYTSHQHRAAFFDQLEERLNAIPGVESASLSSELPIFSFVHTDHVLIEGRPWQQPGEAPLVYCPIAGPNYFKALGIRLRQGRVFTQADAYNGRPVVVINEALAKRFWPSEGPLGKRISISNPDEPKWREIVGVVADVRFPGDPMGPSSLLQVYRPLAQDDVSTGGMIAMRTKLSADSMRTELRRTLAELDPDLPVYGIQTVPQILERSRTGSNLVAGLLAAFGVLGLVLAAVGIYGVTSYFTAQRTNEFGIRMALGARNADVLSMVTGQGLRLGAGGALLGLGGSVVVMRLLDSLIPAGSPMRDPAALAGVPIAGWGVAIATAAGLVAVAWVACYLPARSAARIDPMKALRYE